PTGQAAPANRRRLVPGGGRRARWLLGPEPVLPALQAPRRRHAGAVPEARKNRLTGRKSRQETAQRPPYHSPEAAWVGVIAPRAASWVRGERTRVAMVRPSSAALIRFAPSPRRHRCVGASVLDGRRRGCTGRSGTGDPLNS